MRLRKSRLWGGEQRKAVAALMEHPWYREAHGSDDHFLAALFVAGLAWGGGMGMVCLGLRIGS